MVDEVGLAALREHAERSRVGAGAQRDDLALKASGFCQEQVDKPVDAGSARICTYLEPLARAIYLL